MNNDSNKSAIIIGAGYTGLAAAYELIRNGYRVTVLESDSGVGGLAGSFKLDTGYTVEKFYHHWFTSDKAIINLVNELGLSDQLQYKDSSTGLFYANSIFRLSSPLDLLKFKPLPFIDRIRTGLMALYARRIKDWRPLENETASDWIRRVGGKKGYKLIWEPLFRGKFGDEAENISAVWFWNKLKLRGGSRGSKGSEQLLYYAGGFGSLTDSIKDKLLDLGVDIKTGCRVNEIIVDNERAVGVKYINSVSGEEQAINAEVTLCTTPLPTFLKFSDSFPSEYINKCKKIRFLGNVCLVLRLNRSLTDTYWMNVADPTFPFVGIIEHTNFDSDDNYGNEKIAYLSKYLSTSNELYKMENDEFLDYCIPHIQRIIPEFQRSWINGSHLWRAEFSQPVITLNYSDYIPEHQTPIPNLWLATMAQVYPEDRGTNYAVDLGRKVAKMIID